MSDQRPNPANQHVRPTRRAILKAAAASGLGAIGALGGDPPTSQPAHARAESGSIERPWWMGKEWPRSVVAEVRSDRALGVAQGDPTVVRRMVRGGLHRLTGETAPGGALRKLLSGAKRIAVKFNAVGAKVIGTSETVARVVFDELLAAGYAPNDVTLVEAPPYLQGEFGAAPRENGWGAAIPVGDTSEALAAWVYSADAIINVPFLKAHHFAGMSGALKNISHAVIRRPARYHADGCTPAVSQIIANKCVSEKLRLTIMDALRLAARNGPDPSPDDMSDYGAVLVGVDPVAIDSVGRAIINRERSQAFSAGAVDVRYLDDAIRRGLGRGDPPGLEHAVIEHPE